MAPAGHMNIKLPAIRTLGYFRDFQTHLHDDLAHGGAVGGDVEEDPNGGHCAWDGLDPSGFGGR